MLLLLSTFILTSVKGDQELKQWGCANKTRIILETESHFIPYNSSTPVPYADNQMCTWQIIIPTGKYATIKILSNFVVPDLFTIWNEAGELHTYKGSSGDIPRQGNVSFLLPWTPNGTFIEFIATEGISGSLAFSIQLDDRIYYAIDGFNLLLESPSRVETLTITDSPLVISTINLTQTRYIFTSTTNYILNMAVSFADNSFSSCKLYTGNDPNNGTYLMDLIALTNGTIYSFNYTTTIICLQGTLPEGYLFALPLPNDTYTSAVWFMRIGTNISFNLPEIESGAYLTTYCPDGCVEYLQSIDDNTNSSGMFEIYAGMPGSLYLLTSFSTNNSNTSLPQEVRGVTRTYRLTSGSVSLEADKDNSTWTTISGERSGFFMTSDYPFDSLSQSAFTKISGPNIMIFTFTIEEMYVGGGRFYADIAYVDNKEYSVFLQTDMTSEYETNPQKGYSLQFKVEQGNESSKGGLVRFQIVDSTRGLAGSWAVIVVLTMLQWIY